MHLLPTGAGQPVELKTPGVTYNRIAAWFPDGQRILFQGSQPGRPGRLYVVPVSGGEPRPVTPEGVGFPVGPVVKPIAPDGRRVLALAGPGDLRTFDVESGEQTGACRIEPGEEPIRWHADGRSIFLWTPGEFPVAIRRIDVESGEKTHWRNLVPADPTGVMSTRFVVMTPDGGTCAISYIKILSQLHVARGLR